MKVLGFVLFIIGVFVTFAIASTYHAWQPFGIVVMIAGLVAFAAGCIPAE
jgi:hypothetical protein